MPEPTCDCWGLETCPLCYTPPTQPVPPSLHPVRNIWDLPIFAWAWKEDGRDLRA